MSLTKQYNIKWNRSDYLTLGKAVSQFNRKINELNKIEKRNYLPMPVSYAEIKENILTRNELNRVINSLRRFSKSGAEELYTTEAGQQLTKWEFKELGIARGIAKRRLKKEIAELNVPTETGFSKAQMGSQKLKEVEQTLKSLEQLEKTTGFDFERIARRIKSLGTSDYTMRKAYIFQINFMTQLEELKTNFNEFQKVYDYFATLKNPISFFNVTQKSQALQDFFEWYKNPENYADFKTVEDLADYILNEYKEG